MEFSELFKRKKPLIGMIHLFALPPYKSRDGLNRSYAVRENIKKALADLNALEKGGVDAALIENDDDPSDAIYANKEQYDAMLEIVKEVVKHAKIPVGVNMLRNDWKSSFLIAKETGCKFIRLDNFVDKVNMAGKIVQEDPSTIAKFREEIGAQDIVFLTDVHVKCAELLEEKTLTQSVKQAIKFGSDGIIVTGTKTGEPPTVTDLKEAKLVSDNVPILVGSGLNSSNSKELFNYADGAIVGTSLKTGKYVDVQKVNNLINSSK